MFVSPCMSTQSKKFVEDIEYFLDYKILIFLFYSWRKNIVVDRVSRNASLGDEKIIDAGFRE